MKYLNYFVLTLLIIGAINWGLVGLFKIDLIGMLFNGMTSVVSRIIFTIVGLAGLFALTFFTKIDDDDEHVETVHD